MTYSVTTTRIGIPDITAVPLAGFIGAPGVAQLPSTATEAQLGEIVTAWDATLGGAEFILLQVPVSTAVTVGLLYQFDNNYTITLLPAGGTSKNTGVPVVAAYTAVTSNSTTVQYSWFLIEGVCPVLKTAVTVSPKTAVYISATAGRIYVTSSTGKQILGARTANTATVTSTTSTVNVFLDRSAVEGA